MKRFGILVATAMLALFARQAAADDATLKIEHAWARATPGSAQNGVAYMTIESTAPDRLLSASTPVAGKAEVHENTTENGVMKMRLAGPLTIDPGKTLELKPGGYHVMLMEMKQPLKAGETFLLTLTFEKGGTRQVTVMVEKTGAMGAGHDGMSHPTMPKKSP